MYCVRMERAIFEKSTFGKLWLIGVAVKINLVRVGLLLASHPADVDLLSLLLPRAPIKGGGMYWMRHQSNIHRLIMNNSAEMSSVAAQPQQESSDWTTVVFDLRRSVSNLVLYVLESMPLPWVFPPVASAQNFQQFQSDVGASVNASTESIHYGKDNLNGVSGDWFVPPLPPLEDVSLLLPSLGQQPQQQQQPPPPVKDEKPKRAAKKKSPNGHPQPQSN